MNKYNSCSSYKLIIKVQLIVKFPMQLNTGNTKFTFVKPGESVGVFPVGAGFLLEAVRECVLHVVALIQLSTGDVDLQGVK